MKILSRLGTTCFALRIMFSFLWVHDWECLSHHVDPFTGMLSRVEGVFSPDHVPVQIYADWLRMGHQRTGASPQ